MRVSAYTGFSGVPRAGTAADVPCKIRPRSADKHAYAILLVCKGTYTAFMLVSVGVGGAPKFGYSVQEMRDAVGSSVRG